MTERHPRTTVSVRLPTIPVRLFRLAAAAGLTASLAACAPTPGTPDVSADLPAAWREGEAKGPEVRSDWVRDFGSPELVRLVEAADRDNLDNAAAEARVVQAEAQLAGARADLAPTVTASGDASRSITPGTRTQWSPPFKASAADAYSLGLGASWTIDLNGRLRALAASQAATTEAARIDRDAARLTTATAIADAWLRIGAAREQIRIARESVATAERTLTVYRHRLEVGTATALDVAQQESLVASQRAAVPDLEIDARQTRNALAVLLARAPEVVDVKVASVSGVRVPRVGAGVPSRLLDRRPDVATAEANLRAAAANVDAARAAYLPTVSLTGSTGFASAFLKNLLRPDAIASSAAASVAETVFDGGSREAAVGLAEGRRVELVADYRKSVLGALSDVENALVAIDQNRRHEQLQQAVVVAARKAQRLTEERLAEGTIDITTVLEAERTLFSAEQTLVTVRLARLQAVVAMVSAMGGGWTREEAAVRPAAGSDTP